MSQIEVERFLGRLITDEGFRKRAAASLISVCFSEGIALSREEMLLLCHMDFSRFRHISEALDDAIRRK